MSIMLLLVSVSAVCLSSPRVVTTDYCTFSFSFFFTINTLFFWGANSLIDYSIKRSERCEECPQPELPFSNSFCF